MYRYITQTGEDLGSVFLGRPVGLRWKIPAAFIQHLPDISAAGTAASLSMWVLMVPECAVPSPQRAALGQ